MEQTGTHAASEQLLREYYVKIDFGDEMSGVLE